MGTLNTARLKTVQWNVRIIGIHQHTLSSRIKQNGQLRKTPFITEFLQGWPLFFWSKRDRQFPIRLVQGRGNSMPLEPVELWIRHWQSGSIADPRGFSGLVA